MAESDAKAANAAKAAGTAADSGEPAEAAAAEPQPANKADLAPLPGLEEAVAWIGEPVDDCGGQRLGKVTGVYADVESKIPRWLVIRLGRFAGDAAIPFDHTAEGGGRVWVAYEREEVRSSPKLNAGQALNAGQELQLCEHYEIREGIGRAAEVAERKADQLSAVPAP